MGRRTPQVHRTKTADLERLFALEWLRNGYCSKRAYLTIKPGVTERTAGANGARMLKRASVQARIREGVEKQLGSLQMAADAALGRLGLIAQATLDMAFDEQGRLLEPQAWPPALREAVRDYDGEKQRVRLTDKLQALRTILELAGKLRSPVSDSVDALAEAILVDRERRAREREERERRASQSDAVATEL